MRNPWCDELPWSFKTPPTFESLNAAGHDPQQLALLALNESPLAPVSQVAAAASAAVGTLNRYPDNHFEQLTRAVANATGMDVQQQVWAAGASDLIYRVVGLASREGGHIVSPAPTFWGYERVYALTGADVTRVALCADGGTDIDALIAAITADTTVVTLTTPANPSGLAMTRPEFEEIASAIPDRVLFLVDEVYHEFAAFEGEFDVLQVLRDRCRSPWLVLRSFSKAYRLAGARVGYGLASNQTIAQRVQNHAVNFAVSSLSFAAALAAYANTDSMSAYLEFNATQRAELVAALRALGLSVLESRANFVSAELPIAAASANALLAASGIYCGQWHDPAFANMIRIGVGMADDNARLIQALDSLLCNKNAR